jgi:hypothetical protein
LSKLNVTNRIEAATYAVRHHIERIGHDLSESGSK